MPSQSTSTSTVAASALTAPNGPISNSTNLATPSSTEADALIARLSTHRAVRGVLILSTPEHSIIRSSGPMFDGEEGRKYARVVGRVVRVVREGVQEVGEGDELKFMRVRTRRHELMITPDERYILVVLQDPTT